jgi:DNA (cytosine-5)-methyltransferase 1
MNELALFAGGGGGILAGKLLGWSTVCAVEIDPYARRVLLARQRDGTLDHFPIWDDVKTFDGKPWRGYVDVVSGGFPCQDISSAGRGAGISGERSGLWSEMARICSEAAPQVVYVENSPMLTGRGLDRVLMDLAKMGYDARWGVLSAAEMGAPHQRKRIWILAHSHGGRQLSESMELELYPEKAGDWKVDPACDGGPGGVDDWWASEPRLDRVANGMAYWVDRLRAIGNGQCPVVAAEAFRLLAGGIAEQEIVDMKDRAYAGVQESPANVARLIERLESETGRRFDGASDTDV